MGTIAPNNDHKFCPNCGSPTEKYLTLEQVAAQTSMSVEFWRSRIQSRDIDYVKIGRSVRIPQSSLNAVIKPVSAINTTTINNLENE
ncbi:MAG: helix-turn-helix domain-containing protein [Candidatus Marinimicrobia bacterium]|nr:helix-turn-helix domain-containing protein [Candidatus Neomarinimicrobiota bacterium]MBT3679259.1 helix-turn-helix domain-containing protein [Candidatus Neomarinimicrobiota bacterium]MBT3950694.1 helix-turn-helix domain-containing protein [Candidatus Neomarinimicrobiota bacterium]MBT4253302.1 helix-turn-helix domain-containing protein [Candidatus Neomarinimicrobiota bacterium]MBT5236714.1 helix-turn-helix domain-containing protein [Candidatus Neomarinimicrobiota bacterium]